MSGRAQVIAGQAPLPVILPTYLTLTRDKYGRFRPKAAPPPGSDPQADFLEANRITPRMQAAALADYVPPEDAHDKDQLERRLREYIVANLGTWVNGRHCNLQMVFAALKDTYAIDQRYYTSLLAAARAARTQTMPIRAAGSGQRVLTFRAAAPGHGARAFCPPDEHRQGVCPSAETSSLRTYDQRLTTNDLPLGSNEVEFNKRAECPRSVALGEPVHSVTVNAYDPDYDVVANLSQKVKNALCPEGSYQGFGNDPQQAVESYYAKNKGEMRSYGGDWEMYGMGCKVYEQFDKNQRPYYVARVDGSVDRKAQEATLFGYVATPDQSVGEGLAPSRSADLSLNVDSWVGAGPAPARGEQSNSFIYHRDTKTTEQSELGSSSRLSRWLGGEKTAGTPTTAGGHKALPYNVGDISESWRLGALAVNTAPRAATPNHVDQSDATCARPGELGSPTAPGQATRGSPEPSLSLVQKKAAPQDRLA